MNFWEWTLCIFGLVAGAVVMALALALAALPWAAAAAIVLVCFRYLGWF